MDKTRLGLIGVGLLGGAMAERLVGRGVGVLGSDLDPSRREALRGMGGEVAPSACEVARSCDRVILSLPTSDVAAEVVAQVEASLRPGATIIDTTTGEPADAVAMGARLAARGVAYLDATVSGSSEQARRGEVVVMVGGDPRSFADCRDVFDAIARAAFHVGPVGAGARMKLATNLVLGLNRAALAEGLAFARRMGLDPSLTLEAPPRGGGLFPDHGRQGPEDDRGRLHPPGAALAAPEGCPADPRRGEARGGRDAFVGGPSRAARGGGGRRLRRRRQQRNHPRLRTGRPARTVIDRSSTRHSPTLAPTASPSIMYGLPLADVAVLVVYLLGTTALGIWVGRRSRTVAEYFMPRKFSKPVMIMYAFGTGTASDQAVTVAAATFRYGLSGIWYQWLWLFATPFYWMIAPIMRRFRAITTADVYELRFDRGVARLFAVLGIVSMTVKMGVLLKGSSSLLQGCTDGRMDAGAAMLAMCVLFVLYGTIGGLTSVILTDFVQGLLTILFSFMLLPLVMHAVGGMAGIRQTIRDPSMFSLVAPGKIGAFFIVMYGVQALVGIVAQPFVMGTCSAGKSEMDGRVGFMGGNFVKRLCTIGWCLTALAAVAWYLGRGVSPSGRNPDRIYGDLARGLLPPVAPGLLGLFVASMLASVMSSCSAYMITSSALFTENLYRPYVRGRSPRITSRRRGWCRSWWSSAGWRSPSG